MITIITASPGGGKTSEMVAIARDAAKAGRLVYACGVNGLTVPHTPLVDLTEWHELVPDGSLVLVDEVQEFWRPMGPGQKVPEDIKALEKHRHRGIDFVLTTQGPKLVHANVRELVGRHVHIRDLGFLGRWWYEWAECADNPKGAWKSAPLKKKHRLDRSTFALYKSASVHVKPVRSFPKMVLVLVLAVAVMVGLGVTAARRISAKTTGEVKPVAQSASAASYSRPTAGNPTGAPITAQSIVASFTPRIAARPDTAPAYDHLRVVQQMPRFAGGWCRDGVCHCMTQQSTDLGVTQEACAALVAATPFDPYRLPAVAVASAAPEAPKLAASMPF